ncbi:hypothetical protein BT96DRAFT_930565 [Gymnopus androsaceus JB14]|uniref:Uncharacterized protein n=1 Tax=Gymnopus androsaceus JB14 TaxID=1447944 RepID=A0A6A4IP51_9AGAR|nr:hypothetical protein BT96DRAFT_930565 [Gymnopus androsaceus JB14]
MINTTRKHAEMIAQEVHAQQEVATAMQAKEAALTKRKTKIASLRNQIKKSNVKANYELKQSKLATLQPQDKAGWKVHFTTEIMKQYNSETGPGPQGANQFQLYFDDGWHGSELNLSIIKNMTSFALANRADQCFKGSLSTEAIHAIIWGHILQARDSWIQWKPHVYEEERDKFETAAEATTQAQIDQVKKYKSVHKANHK